MPRRGSAGRPRPRAPARPDELRRGSRTNREGSLSCCVGCGRRSASPAAQPASSAVGPLPAGPPQGDPLDGFGSSGTVAGATPLGRAASTAAQAPAFRDRSAPRLLNQAWRCGLCPNPRAGRAPDRRSRPGRASPPAPKVFARELPDRLGHGSVPRSGSAYSPAVRANSLGLKSSPGRTGRLVIVFCRVALCESRRPCAGVPEVDVARRFRAPARRRGRAPPATQPGNRELPAPAGRGPPSG